jgi:hypothetical protein
MVQFQVGVLNLLSNTSMSWELSLERVIVLNAGDLMCGDIMFGVAVQAIRVVFCSCYAKQHE